MSTFGRLTSKVVGIVALAAVAALLGLGALVYIQPTEAATDMTALEHRGGGGRGGGFCGAAGMEAAAEALGLTTEELQTELWGGATLSSLAENAGVELQAVQDAVNAACKAETRTAIEQAVTDGTITQAKADWLLEGLDAGFWGPGSEGGQGFGIGFGPRGFGGGRGQFGPPSLNPMPTPSTGGSS
ncbi:MAG: hypothetical protein ACT4QE_03870 [Anaerolineales bacterium]